MSNPSSDQTAQDQAGPIWFREDLVMNALESALQSAVESGGRPAKVFAWDVSHTFRDLLRGGRPNV
jgi:hypothetical protein